MSHGKSYFLVRIVRKGEGTERGKGREGKEREREGKGRKGGKDGKGGKKD
jgi:hypothetical protein